MTGDLASLSVFQTGPPPAPLGQWNVQGGHADTFVPPCDTLACPAIGPVQPMAITLGAQATNVQVSAPAGSPYLTDLTMDGGPGNDTVRIASDGGPKRVQGGDGADLVALLPPGDPATGVPTTQVPGEYVLDGGPGMTW